MRQVAVRHGGSPTTRWTAALAEPTSVLAGLVESYCEYAEHSASPVRRREVPGPATVLVVELAGPLRARGAADPDMSTTHAFVGAPGRGPALTRHDGRQHCVEIRLTPFGAYRLFGALPDLAGRIVSLTDLLGRRGAELTERMVAGAGWPDRFDLLDDTLAAIADTGPRPQPEVRHAWRRLVESGGTARIGYLAAEIGWSRTRMTSRFLSQTGLSPKAAASVLRFDRAVGQLSIQDSASLADIALSCGYYDQAHFNRDFRELAGCTPTEWRRGQGSDLVGTVL